ncbi:hypothetical protein [Hymenobacter radiodurans]|uniref:hypothetical protein n=1 Tax=Hymenobacter radiodurans TaxID=2496028 RepID=UPI0010584773|nr:hypothetical protein [Hymenobacter radiodurans]
MKKLNLIIVLLFVARWASAQDVAPLSSPAAGVETIHSAKTAVLGLSYAYERALTPLTTLNTELILNGALEVREGSYFFALAPVLLVEPRYYYNFLKRSNKGKNTANNSANYLALGGSYVFGATVGDRVSVQQGVSVVPKWGLRRPLGQRFFFETAIGLGIQKRAKLDMEPALGLDIKFGYALGKRSTH